MTCGRPFVLGRRPLFASFGPCLEGGPHSDTWFRHLRAVSGPCAIDRPCLVSVAPLVCGSTTPLEPSDTWNGPRSATIPSPPSSFCNLIFFAWPSDVQPFRPTTSAGIIAGADTLWEFESQEEVAICLNNIWRHTPAPPNLMFYDLGCKRRRHLLLHPDPYWMGPSMYIDRQDGTSSFINIQLVVHFGTLLPRCMSLRFLTDVFRLHKQARPPRAILHTLLRTWWQVSF